MTLSPAYCFLLFVQLPILVHAAVLARPPTVSVSLPISLDLPNGSEMNLTTSFNSSVLRLPTWSRKCICSWDKLWQGYSSYLAYPDPMAFDIGQGLTIGFHMYGDAINATAAKDCIDSALYVVWIPKSLRNSSLPLVPRDWHQSVQGSPRSRSTCKRENSR